MNFAIPSRMTYAAEAEAGWMAAPPFVCSRFPIIERENRLESESCAGSIPKIVILMVTFMNEFHRAIHSFTCFISQSSPNESIHHSF